MSVTRTKYLVSQVRAVPQLSSTISIITKVKNSHPSIQPSLEKLQKAYIGMKNKVEDVDEKTHIDGVILQPLPAKRLEHKMTLKNGIRDNVLEQRHVEERQN